MTLPGEEVLGAFEYGPDAPTALCSGCECYQSGLGWEAAWKAYWIKRPWSWFEPWQQVLCERHSDSLGKFFDAHLRTWVPPGADRWASMGSRK